MSNDKDAIERNRPAEDGRKNDPDIRDRSDMQPGVSTMSSSPTDAANQQLTQTAADNFRTSDFGAGADKKFDKVEENEHE